jgi:hypothetical protein
MPLLDHFHPPLSSERRWESFYSSWATRLADALTERWLPPNYIAEEHAHLGPSIEIDVGTFEREAAATGEEGSGVVATVGTQVWAPPAADGALPAVFPDTFEVRVLSTDSGPKLVAAIELISPGNKDRPAERAFATKCASYLYQGISVLIVDIVTNRRANLHNEILRVMEAPDSLALPPESSLYAVAYRPLRRGKGDEIDVWRSSLALGQALPTLPLGLRADLVIPVDFEAAYAEACLRKRLTGS